jgi:hypothetical protein
VIPRLIGKIGGTEVETMAIDFPGGANGATTEVATVPVPTGKPHTVVLVTETGAATGGTSASQPQVRLGAGPWTNYSADIRAGLIAHVSGPVTIQSYRRAGTGQYLSGFTGTVYYWPTD